MIVAFDANTGKEIWKLEGEPCTYSSPVLIKMVSDSDVYAHPLINNFLHYLFVGNCESFHFRKN